MKISDFFREVYTFGDIQIVEVGSSDVYLLVKKINGVRHTMSISRRFAYVIFRHYSDSLIDKAVRKVLFAFIQDKNRYNWKPLTLMDSVISEKLLKKFMPVDYERIRIEEIERNREFDRYLSRLKKEAGHGERSGGKDLFYVTESVKKEEDKGG